MIVHVLYDIRSFGVVQADRLAADGITNCLIKCGLLICIWLAGPLQYEGASALRY